MFNPAGADMAHNTPKIRLYRIVERSTGVDYGVYRGRYPTEAVDAMFSDSGSGLVLPWFRVRDYSEWSVTEERERP